jgi:hypothetical protein
MVSENQAVVHRFMEDDHVEGISAPIVDGGPTC